jgi:hypothetical protein
MARKKFGKLEEKSWSCFKAMTFLARASAVVFDLYSTFDEPKLEPIPAPARLSPVNVPMSTWLIHC